MPIYRIGSTKVLFIHIPKTAGMALDSHLTAHSTASIFSERLVMPKGVFGPRHQPARVLTKVFLPEMIDYAFTVVRHPVARLVSEYRYQRRGGPIQLSRFRFMGFNTWLRYSLWRIQSHPNWRGGHFRPQTDYLCFDAQVFRFEDGLPAVMQGVSKATGIDIPFHTPERNVSAPREVRMSQTSLDRIIRTYAADFERFGYSKDLPQIKGVTLTR